MPVNLLHLGELSHTIPNVININNIDFKKMELSKKYNYISSNMSFNFSINSKEPYNYIVKSYTLLQKNGVFVASFKQESINNIYIINFLKNVNAKIHNTTEIINDCKIKISYVLIKKTTTI